MYFVGELIGAFVIAFVLSRIAGAALARWVDNPKKLVIANGVTLIVTTVLGGFGFGNAVFAFGLYVLPVLSWTALDLVRWHKGTPG